MIKLFILINHHFDKFKLNKCKFNKFLCLFSDLSLISKRQKSARKSRIWHQFNWSNCSHRWLNSLPKSMDASKKTYFFWTALAQNRLISGKTSDYARASALLVLRMTHFRCSIRRNSYRELLLSLTISGSSGLMGVPRTFFPQFLGRVTLELLAHQNPVLSCRVRCF